MGQLTDKLVKGENLGVIKHEKVQHETKRGVCEVDRSPCAKRKTQTILQSRHSNFPNDAVLMYLTRPGTC